ncbi:hypothetical protein KFE25_006072 [Diacronema lutheri]|uniref:Uncharacterized protein n=1 Tax=Diacronema lutheri TaxID=2081491 RepID=A0A8J5XVX5_DIALT|nr:hypothetical protein KFE25_006072 [Diacronema lutheri]
MTGSVYGISPNLDVAKLALEGIICAKVQPKRANPARCAVSASFIRPASSSSREAARAESEEGAPAAAGPASLLALEFQRQHLTPVLARSVRPPTAGCAHACRY